MTERGDVIEYVEGEQRRLGVVLETGKSLLVVNSEGKEQRVSTRSVKGEPGLKVSVMGGAAGAHAALTEVESELDGLVSQGAESLGEVWELLLAEGEPVDLETLTQWLMGGDAPLECLAAARVLRQQPAYFKQKKALWTPRDDSQVKMILQQQEAEAAAAAALGVFLDGIGEVAAAAPGDRPAALSALTASPEFRKRLELIEGYALGGDDYDKASQANDLMERAIAHGKLKVGGKGWVRAFEWLVAVGHFSVHENLPLRRMGLDAELDPSFIEHAEALVAQVSFLDATELAQVPEAASDPAREDLTGLAVVTIDDASTRDIDDGISLVSLEGGGFEVGVHIADPAEVVPLDHPLEAEARRRGTSVYTPMATVPMFPRVLSEGAMSLVEGRVRPALSFLVTLDEEMRVVERRLCLSWVKVCARLSYDGADQMIAGEVEHPRAGELQTLSAIAGVLKRQRLAQGAVVMEIPEARIKVRAGEPGQEPVVDVGAYESTASRELVQEMMVLAGETAGSVCREAGLPVLYRIQPRPEDPAKEEALAGKVHGLVESFQLRRYMQRGSMSGEAGAHFGLGLPAYVQATSPIRRYSDLMAHRQLRAWLRGEALPYSADQVAGIATQLDGLAGQASFAERDGKNYWGLVWLSRHQGEVLDATVLNYKNERKRRVWVWLHALGVARDMPAGNGTEPGARIQVTVGNVHPRRDMLVLKPRG